MASIGSSAGKLVCVTGGSGYVASGLVKCLLERGYTVRATTRDLNNPKKVDPLLKLDGAKERLQLFQANLLDEGAYDSAIQGCDGVFHVASPCTYTVNDPQADMIDPAVKGTLNVLKSCVKSPSVKRVVFTSSIAAVFDNDRPKSPEVVLDETWWSDPELCREQKLWYPLSKTLAEDLAWKFAKENKIDLVVVLPGMVAGPPIPPVVNFSLEPIYNAVTGLPFQNRSIGWVDAKDCAKAHIEAYEIASASGRYNVVERVLHDSQVNEILRKLYPTLPISDKCADDKPFAPLHQYSQEKAKSLGIEFTPIEISIKETVESFREQNIVNF